MATVLENIKSACVELGLLEPASSVGSSDLTALQMFSLSNRLANNLLSETDWQSLTKEYQFTTVSIAATATRTSGSNILTGVFSGITTDFVVSGTGIPQDTKVLSANASTIVMSNNATSTGSTALLFMRYIYPLPTDYHHIIIKTEYDKTNRWSIPGSETPADWQLLKSGFINSGLQIRFRVVGDKFHIFPYQSGGITLGYEYVSRNYAIDSNGVANPKFTMDTDSSIFPDNLMILGLKNLFWQIKEYDSTVTERDYQRELSKHKNNQKPPQCISLAPKMISDYVNVPQTGYGS